MTLILPELISKESIPGLSFESKRPFSDSISEEMDRKIFQAMVMGNTYRKKVTITFNTDEGVKQVETTVWGTTNRGLLLKNGIRIPLGSIIDIEA